MGTRPSTGHRLLLSLLPLAGCAEAPGGGDAVRAGTAMPLAAMLAEADSLYAEARFDSAAGVWNRALTILEGTDGEPEILTSLGLAARNLGDYREARRLGERALELKRARGLDAQVPRSLNALGLVAWEEGRLADAESLYREGLTAAQRVGDDEYAAKLIQNLGLVQLDLGRFDEAGASFREALAMVRRIGDRRAEARMVTNLAVRELWLGNPASALERLEDASRLHHEVRDPVGEIEALGQRGVALAAMGELRQGFVALDSALQLARQHGLREEEASNLEMLADLHAEAGDYRRAVSAYGEAAALYEAMGAPVEVGDILRSKGRLQWSAGARAQGEEAVRLALERHATAGAALEVVDDLIALAEMVAEAGDASAADSLLAVGERRAAELDASTRDRVTLARARVAGSAGRPADVLTALDRLSRRPERMHAATAWEVHALRARAYGALGAGDSATAAGRRAVAEVERVRRRIEPQMLRTSYVSRMASVYGDLVILLLAQGAVEEAFAIADAARGRALLEHLATVRDATAATVVELAEADALLRRIDQLVDRLEEVEPASGSERSPPTPAESALLADLEAVRSRYESLLLRYRQRHPAPAALVGARRTSAREVRSSLSPDEALAEYLVLEDRVVIFVARPDRLWALQSMVDRVQLASRVRLARELVGSPDAPTERLRPVLETLHGILIEPVLDALGPAGVRRLTIVPHGPLVYLPFAALADAVTGRPLADDVALRVLPNAGALAAAARNAPSGRPARLAAFAPFPDRLPATGAEARLLRGLDAGVSARIGPAATEAAVRAALVEGRPVHIASHGVMNARNPMFSRIELAGGGSAASDDGRLEVHELLTLRSATPLVFLSGCETGLGSGWSTGFDARDDYATLAQAFLYSGVETVVATLWRIEDDGAAEFARHFYHHLRSVAPPEAVAAAQRDLRRSGPYAHPYYWAGYTVSGGGASAPTPSAGPHADPARSPAHRETP